MFGSKQSPISVYQHEAFQSDDRFSRLFDSDDRTGCEAARRTLLSQGYVITQALPVLVTAIKKFQPAGDIHVEISFTVVCAPANGPSGQVSTVYASAQQERFVVKKNANSTSLGVSAFGSISIPLSSSEDSLVKVASETIGSGDFYDRFFALVAQSLHDFSSQLP